MVTWKNGNALITIANDGTRTTEWEDQLKLDYPMNVDIRVSNKCAFGKKTDGTAICSFCHESAKFDGEECNYSVLLSKLDFPAGIELAIGCNHFSDGLYDFVKECTKKGYICNLTINQGHVKRDKQMLLKAINAGYVKGLGISYRKGMSAIPDEILKYDNFGMNVIIGIDSVQDVLALSGTVRKIVILGEKNFGFNSGKVNTNSIKHKAWRHNFTNLLNAFEVVSFDNLGIEQMQVKEKISKKDYDTMYQGEHSIYIDAVAGTYAASSRSFFKTSWHDMSPSEYFRNPPKMIQLRKV